MKKQLIVMAGLTAMFAACTNEDVLENFENNKLSKVDGITFSVVEDLESRGDFKMDEATGKFKAAWNAEADYINVAYCGVDKGTSYTLGLADPSVWNQAATANRGASVTTVEISANVAEYKATKTAAKGEFTSKDEGNLLKFAEMTSNGQTVARPASFRIYRGNETSKLNYSTDANKVETMNLAVTIPAAQVQANAAKAPFDNFVMVSDPINDIHSYDLAVGESLDLSFERAFAGLAIKTTGYDKATYGALQSVTVTMGSSAIAGSVNLDIAKKVNGVWSYSAPTATGNTVTTTISAGEWSDSNYAFMQILPVDRSGNLAAETYTVTLTFENGAVVVEKTSSKNWTANNFYTINVDLTAATDYLLNGTKLTVIKAMPQLDGANIKGTATAAASITEFKSNVVLSATDLALLKSKFTGITAMTLANDAASLGANLENIVLAANAELTLTAATTAPVVTSNANLVTLNCPEVTTIPAEAYTGNTTITKYNFPKVQTIGANAFEDNTQITHVGVGVNPSDEDLVIGTYNTLTTAKTSALTAIGDCAFKGTNIVSIDAPAVTALEGNPFDSRATEMTHLLLPALDWNTVGQMTQFLAISNNEEIQEIDFTSTLNLGGNSLVKLNYKNDLEKVILGEGANVGTSAFMSANTTAAVEFVNLNKVASVGESAFENVKFAAVNKDVNMSVAEIGKNAFKGTDIETFDFEDVTTIGAGAFENAISLNNVMVTNVETIEANTFAGCTSLSSIVLGATTIKDKALSGLATSARITLTNAVVLEGTPFGAMTTAETVGNDGTTAAKAIDVTFGYTLDANDSQEGVNGSTLTWLNGTKYYKAIFTKVL